MRIVNRTGLPQSIVNAVKNDAYRKCGDLSTTEIINPPWQAQLRRQFLYDIVEDAKDRIWALLGSAVHYVLERGEAVNEITEVRLGVNVLGKVLTGKFDLFCLPDRHLIDYKVTSVYQVMKYKHEWDEQMNINAELIKTCMGIDVEKVSIIAILKDWHESDKYQEGYPQSKVHTVECALWPQHERREFILKRVSLHSTPTTEVCSPADRWESSSTKWAIKKYGNKRYSWFRDSKEGIEQLFAEKKLTTNEYEIVEIRPKPRRCLEYCNVNQFCKFYQDYMKDNKRGDTNGD